VQREVAVTTPTAKHILFIGIRMLWLNVTGDHSPLGCDDHSPQESLTASKG